MTTASTNTTVPTHENTTYAVNDDGSKPLTHGHSYDDETDVRFMGLSLSWLFIRGTRRPG